MECNTLKNGKECNWMKSKGCGFPSGACHPIIDKCENCKLIEVFEGIKYCSVYQKPSAIWVSGCPRFTERKMKVEEVKLLNPLKASKKSSKKKK